MYEQYFIKEMMIKDMKYMYPCRLSAILVDGVLSAQKYDCIVGV
jgi:hypothetical protein